MSDESYGYVVGDTIFRLNQTKQYEQSIAVWRQALDEHVQLTPGIIKGAVFALSLTNDAEGAVEALHIAAKLDKNPLDVVPMALRCLVIKGYMEEARQILGSFPGNLYMNNLQRKDLIVVKTVLLLHEKKPEKALELLRSYIHTCDPEFRTDVINSLFKTVFSSHWASDCFVDVLNLMYSIDIPADAVTYRLILSKLIRSDRVDMALDLIEDMYAKKIETKICCSIAASSFAKRGQHEALQRLLKSMKARKQTLRPFDVSAVFLVYKRQDNYEALYKFAKAACETDSGIELDNANFYQAISAMCFYGKKAYAFDLFEEFKMRFPHDLRIVSSLINLCVAHQDYEKISVLLRGLKEAGIEADTVLVNILLKMYQRLSDSEKALALFKSCARPDEASVGTLLASCIGSKNQDHLFEALELCLQSNKLSLNELVVFSRNLINRQMFDAEILVNVADFIFRRQLALFDPWVRKTLNFCDTRMAISYASALRRFLYHIQREDIAHEPWEQRGSFRRRSS